MKTNNTHNYAHRVNMCVCEWTRTCISDAQFRRSPTNIVVCPHVWEKQAIRTNRYMLYVTHRSSIEHFKLGDEIGGKKSVAWKWMEICECVNSDDFIRWWRQNESNRIRSEKPENKQKTTKREQNLVRFCKYYVWLRHTLHKLCVMYELRRISRMNERKEKDSSWWFVF